MIPNTPDDPHAGQRVLHYGAAIGSARLVAVLLHGRGSDPEDMVSLAEELNVDGVRYLAPAAAGNTWYPLPFLAPIAQNEPFLSSAMRLLERLMTSIDAEGTSADRVVLAGFSQGACLALEFAARHARRYHGVAGLSGGLIGPLGTPRDYPGRLEGTPVFLGCSDIDAHIPLVRVHESAEVMRRLNAAVDERIYPGMGHVVNEDEVAAVREMLAR